MSDTVAHAHVEAAHHPHVDEALIAEIAPAMLKKLKEDGAKYGRLEALGLVLLSCGLPPMLERQFPEADWLIYAGLALSLLSAASLLLLPIFYKKRNVTGELKYRRVHGKWRWEQ